MPDDWLQHLFPLHRIQFELEFLAPANFHWFHGNALQGMLSSPDRPRSWHARYLAFGSPRGGPVHYDKGDRYRFSLTILPGGIAPLVDWVVAFRRNVRAGGKGAPRLNAPVRLHALTDLHTGQRIRGVSGAKPFELQDLATEARERASITEFTLYFLSPMAIAQPKKTEDILRESNFDLPAF